MCDAQGHLAPFLPTHPLVPTGAMPDFKGDDQAFGTMAAGPFGSSLILPISYAYISMMGSDGLTEVCLPNLPNPLTQSFCVSLPLAAHARECMMGNYISCIVHSCPQVKKDYLPTRA